MKQKKRILFLAPYPAGIGPSQRFRFEQYLQFISTEFKYDEYTFWNEKGWEVLFSDSNFIKKVTFLIFAFLKRFFLMFTMYRYDFVFIHREVSHIGPPIFEWIITKVYKKKTIFDFDDAIWRLNYSQKNRIVKYFKSPKKIEKICAWANTVTVGNTYLASYAKQFNKNVIVIPTTIDTNYHVNKNNSKHKITIGWTGTLTTLKHIDLLLKVLREIKGKYDFNFLVIANDKPNLELDFVEYMPWRKESEIEDLSKIDIGIMPLPDNEWEKGKCGFKGLQYMALQIPTIMSPVGVNSEIIKDGENGFLASTEQEWIDKLELLLSSASLRKSIGIAGRKTVQERYSVEANKQKYLDLFDQLS